MTIGVKPSNAIIIRVNGEPQPFPKKLSSKRSGKIFFRDPDGSKRGWMDEIRRVATEAMKGRQEYPKGIPVILRLEFYRTKPDSAKKRLFPTTTPDCDNLAYSVMNSLKGIVYHDDSQVVQQLVTKLYADDSHEPGVEILVGVAGIAME